MIFLRRKLNLNTILTNTLQNCENKLQTFHSLGSKNSVFKLRILDEISRESCRLIDYANIIQSYMSKSRIDQWQNNSLSKNIQSHPNLFDWSEKCFDLISNLYFSLNNDEKIYNSILMIKFDEEYQFLTDDEKDFVNQLITDYEMKYGINLKKGNSNRVTNLLEEERKLIKEFDDNLSYQETDYVFLKQEVLELIQIYGNSIRKRIFNVENDKFYFKFTNNDLSVLLSGSLRRGTKIETKLKFFGMLINSCSNNIRVLSKLLSIRNQYAKLLNYQNYSQFSLQNNTLLNEIMQTNTVIKYLKSKFQNLEKDINFFVKEQENDTPADKLEFFLENEGLIFEETSISLLNIIDLITKALKYELDLTIKILPNTDETHLPFKTLNLELLENGKSLGFIFIDIYKSENEPIGRVQQSVLVNFSKHGLNSFEKPKMFISCRFVPENLGEGETFKLRRNDLVNMMHELGHAIHTIVSRHDFQYITSATKIDYAEFIAKCFENIFEKYVSLYIGPPKKNVLSNKLKVSLEQIYYSYLDLKLHSINQDNEEESLIEMEKVSREAFSYIFGSVRELNDNNWYCSISHLMTYPSLYYIYILGENMAEVIDKNELRSLIKCAHKRHDFQSFWARRLNKIILS